MHFLLLLTLTAQAQDLTATADQVVTALTDGEFEQAEQLADQAISSLSSLETPADTQALATLWQVLGTLGTYGDSREDLIAPNFAVACAMAPGWFNERLGSKARARWEEICQVTSGSATLQVEPVPTGSSLFVDGRLQGTTEVPVRAGTHLVQVLGSDHEPFARLVDLRSGQEAFVPTGITVQEPEGGDDEGRHIALLGGAGGSLVAAGVLAGLSARADYRYEERAEWCDGTTDNAEAMCQMYNDNGELTKYNTQATGFGWAAGGAAALGLGLGVTAWITW